MANKGSIEAGRGHVTLETRNLLQKGLDEAKATLQAWGTTVMAIGAAVAATGVLIAAPFLQGLDTLSAWGKEMRTAMRQTGMSFEELDLAMDGTRTSADELVPAIAKMDEFIFSAANGSREANQALAEMGISLSDLQHASQGDRLLLLADGLNRIGDAGQRIARQRDVFGRGGLSLNIEGGAAGMRSRAARADYLEGETLNSRATLELVGQYNTAKREFGMAMSGFWATLGAAAAPVMTDFLRMITQIVVGVRQWLEANRPLLTTIFYVADKLILLGTIIGFVGSMIYAGAYAFTFIGGAISIVGGVISWFVSLASGGFGLLTVLSWGWGAATFAAGMIATAALLVYKTGLLALTAITWLWNAAGAALAAVLGLFSGAATVATGATGGYTIGLIAAWIWENICSVGITLLITALGALVIAIGAVVLALGGFVIFAVAVAFLPMAISALADAFVDLWESIGNSTWFANLTNMFGAVVGTAQTAWAGIKAAFDAGEWGLLWEILKVTALLEWEHISNYAMGVFYYWKDAISDTFDEAWTYIKVTFVAVWGEIKALFFDGIAAIASGFTAMVNVIITALNGMIGRVVQGMNAIIDMINNTISRLPQSVRNTLGIGTLSRATAPELQNVADGGQRFRDMARDERRSTQDQVRDIESQAMADWFDEQVRRVERDTALAEGNQARVAELNAELADLTAYAEFLRDSQPALAGAGEAMGRSPGMTGSPTTHVAGSFSAAVIAGFIGASMGAGETRGERETRMARERLDEILRELERRPGVVMG